MSLMQSKSSLLVTRSKSPKTAVDAAPCTLDRVSHTLRPAATAEEVRRASELSGILLALRSRPRPVAVVRG